MEQAALLYLAIMSLDPTGKGRKRWTNREKAALGAFDITFDSRLQGWLSLRDATLLAVEAMARPPPGCPGRHATVGILQPAQHDHLVDQTVGSSRCGIQMAPSSAALGQGVMSVNGPDLLCPVGPSSSTAGGNRVGESPAQFCEITPRTASAELPH